MNNSQDITQAPSPTPDHWPAWFRDRRETAWRRFLELPAPNRKDETWRYGSLGKMNLEGVGIAEFVPTATEGQPGLTFINGYINHVNVNLPEGVLVLPFSRAMTEHPELVKQYFMREETFLGSAKYGALHASHLTDGAFIYVPKGVALTQPIRIEHYIRADGQAVFPHTLIVCEENASVTIVEEWKGTGESADFVVSAADIFAKPGAYVKYAQLQKLNPTSRLVQINASHAEKDARVTHLILNIGGEWVRQESVAKLLGENAESDMLSASVASHAQEYDQRTYQDHAVAYAKSNLLYKNTLFHQAKTTFSGMISVKEGAHFTDAYQTCRNLILSEEAEANSLPGLEINADQVRCSHGTTNATIEDDQIFYLLSRGIDPDTARQMIAQGFSVEAISLFGNEEVEQRTLALLQGKFTSLAD